jgi:hypothetical protein
VPVAGLGGDDAGLAAAGAWRRHFGLLFSVGVFLGKVGRKKR